MSSQIVVLCLVLASCGAIFAQRAQTLLYNPRNPPKVQTLPYNPNNRPHFQTLPYRPQPGRQPIIRVRRDLVAGQASSNPMGGLDAKITAGTGVGDADRNLIGSVYAAGNTMGRGPTATGGALEYNHNGHGLSISKDSIAGVRDTMTTNARVNLVNDGFHKLDANVFKSDNTQANGFQFQKSGGNLDYSNTLGHGAKLGVSSIPNYGRTYEASGTANLWQSPDKNTRFDFTGYGSKTVGGPFDGQKDIGGRFGLTTFFG